MYRYEQVISSLTEILEQWRAGRLICSCCGAVAPFNPADAEPLVRLLDDPDPMMRLMTRLSGIELHCLNCQRHGGADFKLVAGRFGRGKSHIYRRRIG